MADAASSADTALTERAEPARAEGEAAGGGWGLTAARPARGRGGGRGVLFWASVVLLGAVTTLGVAWASAFIPVDVRSGRVPTWLVWGTLGSDGDHRDPWRITIRTPASARSVYFEKGRIYFVDGAGPPGARSESVNCWSYAINVVRADPARFAPGEVRFSEGGEAMIAQTPWTVWGLAEDRRGFPFPAVECRVVGTLDKQAPAVYRVEGGIPLPRAASAGSSGESLETYRVLPYRPLWAGFAGNTLIYAVLWAGVLKAAGWLVGTLTGARAAAQGRCRGCGYDLRGVAPGGRCPECGREREREAPEQEGDRAGMVGRGAGAPGAQA